MASSGVRHQSYTPRPLDEQIMRRHMGELIQAVESYRAQSHH